MENYYILLELSFDPPVTDPGEIKAALHRKKQEWTREQDNPAKRASALRCLEMAGEIERVMLDKRQREEQASRAQKLAADKLGQCEAELRVLEGKGFLLPKEVSAVAVKYRRYGVTRDKVLELARCPVSDRPPEQKIRPEQARMLDPLTANSIQRGLEVLDCRDLYEFLGEAPYAAVKKLRDAAEKKRRSAGNAGTKSAQATATQELAGICLRLFSDIPSKETYDGYLRVNRYPALNKLIEEENTRSGYVSPSVMLRMVNFAVETYGVKVLEAEEYIVSYCAAYDIPLDERGRPTDCPACGKSMPPDGAVCTACGAPLQGSCPGCGSPFSAGPSVCGECGFPLADMVKALGYIDDGQKALIDNNWGTAQRNVQYAKKYWPGHPQIEPLEKRAAALEDRYAWYVDNVGDCVRHNQYYAAQELIDEAQARRLRLPLTTTEHVRKVLAEFEAKLAALGDTPPFEEVFALGSAVEDSIELARILARYPPEPPANLTAREEGRRILLRWDMSPSPGLMDYIVGRKQGGPSLTAFDGDVLYDGPSNSYLDATADPLSEYYYSVFSKRRSAYSDTGVSTGPVLIIPEVESLQILPCDQGAQLTWDFNPKMREVIVWRKLGGERPDAPGEGIRLDNKRIDGFSDHKIKNDVDYWYYLVAAYVVGGTKIYSRGVCDSVTPRKMIAPIEDLAVIPADDTDVYVASWQGSSQSDVVLFVAPKRPELKSGDVVPIARLLSQYRKLDLEARQPQSARFHYPFSGGTYLFPASLLGKFATVGQCCYLTNVRDVEAVTYDLLEGDLYLNMKWPPGIGAVVVAYRYDRFPSAHNEAGATALRVTREQYDYDAGVILREPEPALHYVTVYSEFQSPDGETVYSPGLAVEVDNTTQQIVYYTFQFRRLPFARQGTAHVTLAGEQSFSLPRAVLIGKVGRLPLNKTDGVPLLEIDAETTVQGEISYQYKTELLPKDLYIRLFLREDEGYRRLRLLPQRSPHVN